MSEEMARKYAERNLIWDRERKAAKEEKEKAQKEYANKLIVHMKEQNIFPENEKTANFLENKLMKAESMPEADLIVEAWLIFCKATCCEECRKKRFGNG